MTLTWYGTDAPSQLDVPLNRILGINVVEVLSAESTVKTLPEEYVRLRTGASTNVMGYL